jgi:DNA/RNA non-specific endonuclease
MGPSMTPFERYIRTGRVRRPDALELKFNPWHDPDNGRFTFRNSGTSHRSRSSQRRAGGSFRQHSDDGGHYVAPRLGGTHEYFNHFAQNANFNRGAYRVLEDKWAAYRKAGKAVPVVITPYFEGLSRRPYELIVRYEVDGYRRVRRFKNRKGGR